MSNITTPPKEYYTSEELAFIISTKPQNIRNAINARKIKAVRMGKGYRITKAEVERIKREGF